MNLKQSEAQKKRFARDGGYWLGKKRSEETRLKISEIQLGRKQSKETIEKRRKTIMGHPTSFETREKIRKAQIGKSRPQTSREKNPAWKGGITSLVKLIRHSIPYTNWRKSVFEMGNYTCDKCGDNKGGNLVAHHKDPFAVIFQRNKITSLEEAFLCKEFWDVNNGLTLCELCHEDFHKNNWVNQYGKSL